MNILFARVGYMKFYQGPQKGDEKPIGGGAYNKENIGHEAFNFKNINGNLYGYFQPYLKKKAAFEDIQIRLEKIDPNSKEDILQNVLVIFFAKNPVGIGQVIIGWYKDAKVYRYFQNGEDLKGRDGFSYNLQAKYDNTSLLPINKRKHILGHRIGGMKKGNPGQSNVFYVYDDSLKRKSKNKFNNWIYEAIDYVVNYKGPIIRTFEDEVSEEIETSVFSGSRQGFQSDVEKRIAVESYAMGLCEKHFNRKGYSVEDTSAQEPYDFRIKKDNREYLVEVKGLQTEAEKIILTKNEVELSRQQSKKMILFLVHSIKLNKKSVKKGSGDIIIINPWEIQESNLTPISFTYKLS